MITNEALYMRIATHADPQLSIEGLTTKQIQQLCEYLNNLPKSGVPGMIRSLITMDIEMRWFWTNFPDIYPGKTDEKPEASRTMGGTFAEGFEMAHRGEIL